MARFERLGNDKAYFYFNQEVVDMLEGITPVERAMAVPYVKIWQIEPKTGRPVHADSSGNPSRPITLKLIEPPSFGASIEHRFRERPPVSLQRVSIKTHAPRGTLLQQIINLSFLVHRPDVIFGEPDTDGDSWSSLITPGALHVMEYGWQSSGRHPLLNGDGFVDSRQKVLVPGKKKISFQIVNYDFTIQSDMQFQVNVQAYENGTLGIRDTMIGGLLTEGERQAIEQAAKKNKKPVKGAKGFSSSEDRKLLAQLQDKIRSLPVASALTNVGKMVRFEDVLNELVAPVVESSLRQMGFVDPKLYLGNFNSRAGTTIKKYGGQQLEFIGDFRMPMDSVIHIFAQAFRLGGQMTVENFLKQFLSLFSDPSIWDRSKVADRQNHAIPDVRAKLLTNGDKAALYIVDVKAEVTAFTPSEKKKGNEGKTGAEVKELLKDKGIPYITLMKANSFVLEGASFQLVNDDPTKSILIRRYHEPSRLDVARRSAAALRPGAVDPRQLLYASAIQGQIPMIGNFGFDTFGLIWIDFGVPRWNGPFSIMEREDTITEGGFVTTVTVRAEGEDPLGTQGRDSETFGPELPDGGLFTR